MLLYLSLRVFDVYSAVYDKLIAKFYFIYLLSNIFLNLVISNALSMILELQRH